VEEYGALASPDPYWLCRCEGWQVYAPEGRVGTVKRVLYGSHLDAPDGLVVESGLFRRRVSVASTDEVERVLPEQRRIVVRVAPAKAGLPQILAERPRSGRTRPVSSSSR
jgi:hypothetical protein